MFLSASRYPPSDQVRGQASPEHALALGRDQHWSRPNLPQATIAGSRHPWHARKVITKDMRKHSMRKIAIPDGESIKAISTLIATQLVGTAVTGAIRSFGSMLLLDFGKRSKMKISTLPKRLLLPVGQWWLLIEWSNWTVVTASSKLTNRSEYEDIDKVLPDLLGKIVEGLTFNPKGRLEIRMQGGASLVASGAGWRPRDATRETWLLSSNRHWSIALRSPGKYYVCPDTRVPLPVPTRSATATTRATSRRNGSRIRAARR
jgi:hypothetical protein